MADEATLRRYLDRVTLDLRKAHRHVRDLEQRAHEPIAIVGMACRYPGGVSSPAELWRVLVEGRDVISGLPADRGWDLERLFDPDPAALGTTYVREGGFVEGGTEFDAGFFGIGPREAELTDPQQRQLLEVCWEALEDAGVDPTSLKGTATGVFGSVMHHDYGWGGGQGADGFGPSVGTTAALSGRVAYTLGLEGPAMTVDTACSSSLVAMHLAAGALRQEDCRLALAGGATILSTPRAFLEFSRQRGLAPDGRSKAFAEAADGVGFAEGVGVLVLERLSDAERNGHEVLATIRGSAVNQDGASNGFTAPNGPSQERVIRQALANARLTPQDIDAVEAHGTGTTLGDPIEAGALLATYGQERDEPLLLGSIKSNIGHAQAAAGIAGVIKVVMAMREEVLPKTLHVDRPSSKIDWGSGNVELLTEARGWKPSGRPRRAAVSSFGATGTNGHLILEEAPATDPGTGGEGKARPLPGPVPVVLSAKSEPALREMATRLSTRFTEDPALEPLEVAASLATTRSSFEHRAVALGANREQLLDSLATVAAGGEGAGVARGRARRDGRPVFLFPGQGSQWQGMAVGLLDGSPAFDTLLRECEEALAPHLGWSVREVLRGAPGAPSIERIEVVQPVLFAVSVSLAGLWRSCGVEPAAVAGHSQGEIAAAHIAGGLSLSDAAMLAARRSAIISKLAGKGAMGSVALPAEELEPRLERWQGRVQIAGQNGPSATIVAGDMDSLRELVELFEQEGVRAREVPATIPSHSTYVESLREEVLETLAPIEPHGGEIPFHSTVTGGPLDTGELDAGYWYRNLRQPVRFESVVRGFLGAGQRLFVEVSPHPVFSLAIEESFERELSGVDRAAVLATLRRDEGGPERFALSLAEAHANGVEVDWGAFFGDATAKRVRLPTYPFQRKRYWLDSEVGGSDPGAIGQSDPEHPLLAAAIEGPEGDLTLTGRISLAAHPWLADHALAGNVLLPGSAFLELALKSAEQAGAPGIAELSLSSPLVLVEQGAVQIQVKVSEPGEGVERTISIYSRAEEEQAEWVLRASGRLSTRSPGPTAALDAWPPEGAEPLDVEDLFERLADAGFEYGPAFQALGAAWRDGEEVYAEVSLPEELASKAGGFGLHPALLDSAMQAIRLSEGVPADAVPHSWEGVSLQGVGGSSELRVAWGRDGEGFRLLLADGSGASLGAARSVRARPLDTARLQGAAGRSAYRIEWSEVQLPDSPDEAPEPLLADFRSREGGDDPAAEALATATEALDRLQEALSAEPPAETRLVVLTEGALAVGEAESPDLARAPLAGLVRSAYSEYPGRVALLDTDGTEASARALAAALAIADEPEIALREGEVLVPRLSRAPQGEEEEEAARPFDPERTVLVTGGTSGVGAIVARHFAQRHGARHLLLLSRSGEKAEGAGELKAELEDLGAEVRIAACDVAEREQLAELIDSIPEEHPLGAVVHSAAVMDDAWHLHELTETMEVDCFLLVSSAAAALGAAQSEDAAAAVFLDALVRHRRAAGLAGTSLAWGDPEIPGAAPVSAERAMEILDRSRGQGGQSVVLAELDLVELRVQSRAGALSPILRGLVRSPRPAGAEGSLAKQLAAAPDSRRGRIVLDLVRGHVAAVLGHASPDEVEPERSFRDLGLASVGAVELRDRLATATGLRLPATLAFDYPSTTALADYLRSEVEGSGEATAARPRRARPTDEPIAIVGMACRYPGGATSPEKLWELVGSGADAIGAFPADRGWDLERLYHPDPDNPGTTYVREGGFLGDVGDFDPVFFGISPREAMGIDPQQRLFLEVCWEALEAGGIDPRAVRGAQTGVFAGGGAGDYRSRPGGSADAGGSLIVGASSSVISGRVSYALGFEGPAMTVDTACSSSLVSLHLACQSLRNDECSLALSGGVYMMATPLAYVDLNAQRGFAADGRCKAFAETADGTGFSEGVGVLALERLSDAERNGHRVLAVVRGSAVNQDGASNGLTAPSGPSQARVIRQALATAGLAPEDVDAVEAHGTGTVLGDPIEAGALLATYGQDREEPLWLGSIKSNIGHTGAAAGVAGVIKMTMALREATLPKTLHVDSPSSKVEWSSGRVELLTESVPWKANGRPRRAGVSSFGVSGTNAHVILEEPPAQAGDPEPGAGEGGSEGPLGPTLPLVLSAKSRPALQDAAARLGAHMDDSPELDPLDLAHSLVATRPAFVHRAVALGGDRAQLRDSLSVIAAGGGVAARLAGVDTDQRPAFLFPGYGSQWRGMATGLLDSAPPFKAKLRECEEALEPYLDWSIEDVLRGRAGAPTLDSVDVGSASLFAIMVSLAALWRACGIEPAAVAGHSQGELAAAHVAGGLSLEEAGRIAALRSKALLKLGGKGALASIGLPAEQLESRLERWEGRLALGAINGPAATVASGDLDALDELLAQCASEGVPAKMIPGAVAASHSPQVESIREELMEAIGSIAPRSSEIPFHSTVTGGPLDTAELDAEYWYANARRTVQLEPVVRGLIGAGCTALLEVSPHPVLAIGLRETVEAAGASSVAVLSTLRRDSGGPERFGESLAEAHTAGVEVDWRRFFAGTKAKRVPLPTYPFQRKRYWIESLSVAGDVSAAGLSDPDHPLLGAAVDLPGGALQLTGRLSLSRHRWLADHAVLGSPVVSGGAIVDLVLAAARAIGAGEIDELRLLEPLVLPEADGVQLRVSLAAAGEDGIREVSVHSRTEGEAGEWACNASGAISAGGSAAHSLDRAFPGSWPPEGAEPLAVEDVYDRLGDAGLDLGPAFRGLRKAWSRDDETYAEVALAGDTGDAGRFGVHPALLDAATYAQAGAVARPAEWRGIRLHRGGSAGSLRVRLGADSAGPALLAIDEEGAPVVSVDAFVARPLDLEGTRAMRGRRSLYRVGWSAPEVPPPPADPSTFAVLGDGDLPLPGAARHADLSSLRRELAEGSPPAIVLVDAREASGELPAAAHDAACRTLGLLQEWLADELTNGIPVAVLTQGACAVAEGEDPNLATAPLWGLVGSAVSEQAGGFSLIDVDGAEESWAALPAALALGVEEPQLAIRAGRLLAPRLSRAAAGGSESRPIDPETTVLITGGTSGVGARVARHLAAEHGVRHLLLVSRSGGGAEGAGELKAELEDLGAEVRIAACDVAEREQLAELVDSIPEEHPLGAVVHSAAVLDNAVIGSLDEGGLARVMRPKVDGAWHLHELTAGLDLSQFILFSSVSGIFGNPSQGNYAAANVFLDALAAHRRAHGQPATAIAWGGWMLESSLFENLSEDDLVRFGRLGIGVMDPEQGLEHFDAARAAGPHLQAPVLLDRSALRARAAAGALPAILRELIGGGRGEGVSETTLRERLATLPAEEWEGAVLELVRVQLAKVLGHDSAEEVRPDLVFQEMGIDSIGVLELCSALSTSTGIRVPVLALANNPTPAALARHLCAQLGGAGGEDGAPGDSPAEGMAEATLVAQFAEARERGELEQFVELLTTASADRDSFDGSDQGGEPPDLVRLAPGSGSTALVLVPSISPMSGVHEYVRLAREIGEETSVLSLALPGFLAAEALPADVGALAGSVAEAIAQGGTGDDLILAGHSSGGWVAHAVAAELERGGVQPAALVLLDPYLPDAATLRRLVPAVLGGIELDSGIDDARLTALGGYRRIFAGWEPEQLRAPIFVIRAGEPIAGGEADGAWRASWEQPHAVVDVPGDHFTMLDEHAGSTAEAVRTALARAADIQEKATGEG